MLPNGCRVLCAVSGGADSVYLLHRLKNLADDGEITLACAHFNHRLRGAESDRDANFVKDTAEELKIPFYFGCGNVRDYACKYRLGIEEAARTLRYEFLLATAEKYGFGRIATAHTANDNLETMLLNLCRGAGSAGLSGIPPTRGRIIRPILDVTRDEIERYLAERSAAYVEDSSNGRDDFARNRIRRRVPPVLAGVNAGYLKNALSAAELIRADGTLLDSMAEDFFIENSEKTIKGELRLPVERLAALPEPISGRVIRKAAYAAAGKSPSLVHVQAVLRLCQNGGTNTAADIPGLRARRGRDFLTLSPRGADGGRGGSFTPIPLTIGGITEIKELGINIKTDKIEKYQQINNSFNIFYFKYDAIYGSILVRPRMSGDKLRINGRGVTKSLKKLFSEAGVKLSERDRIPVLADARGVLAVSGFGADERAAAKLGEAALRIELIGADYSTHGGEGYA
jgi:tRNA(Ile)-lysidine synthase